MIQKNKYLFAFLVLVCFACGKSGDNTTEEIITFDPVEDTGNPGIADTLSAGIFYDTFDHQLADNRWEKLHQVWGQSTVAAYQHGGVIRENVSLSGGKAVLRALGDQYTGQLRGANGRGTRLGAVIKTKQRFASGRYEVRMKVLQVADMGVLSAMWTFFYKEVTATSNPQAYQKAVAAGNIVQDGKIILNHEVDIEVKGVNLDLPLFTNWIGEKTAEHNSIPVKMKSLRDNQYHIFRFDWHTGGNGIAPLIAYYIDDVFITESSKNVPYLASHFNIGNWFAWWAGNDSGTYKAPNFESRDMLVDWVKITPFNEANDDWTE